MAKETYSLLLADDSDDDRLFTRRALRKFPRLALVGEVFDGEAVLAWLTGEGNYSDREKYPIPDVLLLDLKMPRMTGHEVLAWLQSRGLDKLCVVVLSDSFLPRDITRSRELGAHAHFKKDAGEEPQQTMLAHIIELLDRS